MRAGRLRHRLQLQSKSVTRDSYGAGIVAWTTEATVWGAIEPLSGREYFAQAQMQAEAKVRIVIRYNSSIDETWRIVHGSTYYDIVDVLNHDQRNYMQTIMCREGVSEDTSTSTTPAFLLLETGDYLLLETGDKLTLDGING